MLYSMFLMMLITNYIYVHLYIICKFQQMLHHHY
nr:MAG TPA: hypothetical protein [Caudoviricetes sp.]